MTTLMTHAKMLKEKAKQAAEEALIEVGQASVVINNDQAVEPAVEDEGENNE